MAKIDEGAPLEQNYEVLTSAIERSLARTQLALDQLRAAKATLDSGAATMAEREPASDEPEADANIDLVVAQMVTSRALSNLWSAADPLNEALGFDEDEEGEEEDKS